MQFIEAPPAPLSIENLMRRVQLDASDTAAIKAARTKVDNIMAIIHGNEPDANGRISQLHLEADAIEQEFLADITAANAERLHDALVRLRDAEVSFSRVNAVCHFGFAAASRALEGVALKVVDAAIGLLDGEAAKVRKTLVASANVFSDDGEIAIFDGRLAVTRANLESERTEAKAAPLHWLSQRGF